MDGDHSYKIGKEDAEKTDLCASSKVIGIIIYNAAIITAIYKDVTRKCSMPKCNTPNGYQFKAEKEEKEKEKI